MTLTGRLTDDPELRYTQSGRARTRFSIAINRRYRDKEGNLQEETTFVPIVVWGPQAEACANFLSKGRQVAVDGRLRIDTFETQEGEKRRIAEVVADQVQFLGPGKPQEAEQAVPEEAVSEEKPEEEIPF